MIDLSDKDKALEDAPVVYTCIVGDFDNLAPPAEVNRHLRHICFTDRPRRVPSAWEARPLADGCSAYNSRLASRYYKFSPQVLFPDARYSVWMDGSVLCRADLDLVLEEFSRRGLSVAAFLHPVGRSVREEAMECFECGKLKGEERTTYKSQLQGYQLQGFDLETVVSWNGFLVRDHLGPGVSEAMNCVWEQLNEHTGRDQLCFQYALWKFGVPFAPLDDFDSLERSELEIRDHRFFFWRDKLPGYLLKRWRKYVLREF